MNIILALVDFLLAFFVFIPCMMVGTMGLDSPGSEKDPLKVLLCSLFIFLPLD